MRKPVVILGVPVDPLNMAQVLDRLLDMVKDARATGRTYHVATVNVDFVIQAMTDPELRYLLQYADLSTADGMPLVWAMRWLGVPVQGRVTGVDLVSNLAERAAQSGISIYFLGGAPGVAVRAAEVLKEKFPALHIAGIHAPAFHPVLEMETTFLDDIRRAKPDILLVAFGNPKQEKWIGMYGRRLGVPVMIGVGASFDFIAGYTRRAPNWMQRAGLEWLFRLLCEPRRLFRRYIKDIGIFGPSLFRQWRMLRKSPGSPNASPAAVVVVQHGISILNLYGRLNVNNLDDIYLAGQQALASSPYLLGNLAQVTSIDSSAAGMFIELGKQARAAGGQLSLASVPASILSTFTFLKMEKLFPMFSDVDAYLAGQVNLQSPAPPASSFVTSRPSGSVIWNVIRVNRILDSLTVPVIFESGACLLEHNPFLVCDFSETVFLTSAGMAALDQLRQIARSQNGELILTNCSPEVIQVIKKANYEQVLPMNVDIAHAVA